MYGQIVEVKVYGPGPSGHAAYKSGVEIVAADRAVRESGKKDYHPETELAYMGLPSSPTRDKQLGGESSKRKAKK